MEKKLCNIKTKEEFSWARKKYENEFPSYSFYSWILDSILYHKDFLPQAF